VVTTAGRQLLGYSLDAIAREAATAAFATEVLVLDNASADDSAEVARRHAATTDVIARAERRDRAENATELLRRARGRLCLLLTESTELEPGATNALHEALDADPRAAAAGATLVRPDGARLPSAWRFPGPVTSALRALGLERRLVEQSGGERVRRVDWASTAALLVRRDAAEHAGWLRGGEAAFCRRLRDAGWHVLHAPEARAVLPLDSPA
jgi:GT2 family glycosyltransferase